MKLRRAIVALTAFLCVLLGLFTVAKYGVHVNRVARETQLRPPADMFSLDPKLHPGWIAAGPSTVSAVCQTIVGQLNAFRSDNYSKAILYQSSTLKSHFGQPSQFRTMIRGMYPEFANYTTIQFGSAYTRHENRAVAIPVRITGVNGRTVDAIYLMVYEQGHYRVGGVAGGFAHENPTNSIPHG